MVAEPRCLRLQVLHESALMEAVAYKVLLAQAHVGEEALNKLAGRLSCDGVLSEVRRTVGEQVSQGCLRAPRLSRPRHVSCSKCMCTRASSVHQQRRGRRRLGTGCLCAKARAGESLKAD